MGVSFLEMLRRFSLGKDPAKGFQFSPIEMKTALRVEIERGVRLTRDGSGNLEWYDFAGRSYDAVGGFPSQHFNLTSFTNSIKEHLLKSAKNGRLVDFVPVELSTFTAEQIAQVKAFVASMSKADQARIFFVGGPG